MNNLKVRFTEIVVGSGALAEGKVWVRVRTRMFLNRGDEVKGLWGNDDYGMGFFLQDREIIAGLRYATEGMRVGGRRKVTIPPHLAFREIGLQEMIPPNAL